MTRASLAVAILVAVYAALLFGPLLIQAAEQIEGHVPARAADLKFLFHARNNSEGAQHGNA